MIITEPKHCEFCMHFRKLEYNEVILGTLDYSDICGYCRKDKLAVEKIGYCHGFELMPLAPPVCPICEEDKINSRFEILDL